MNKFQKLITDSSDSTLKRRAKSLSTQAEVAQQGIVNTLRTKVSELELKIDNLTDFAPDTTDSLRVGSKEWNPSTWATDLQRAKWDLHLAKEQLKVAEETWEEFFADKEEKKG